MVMVYKFTEYLFLNALIPHAVKQPLLGMEVKRKESLSNRQISKLPVPNKCKCTIALRHTLNYKQKLLSIRITIVPNIK